jgi:CubicO group peptidase (beta-lactamase class C family)
MNIKIFLLPAILIGALLAVILRGFAKPSVVKPIHTSPKMDEDLYHEIDAFIEAQRQRLNIPGISLAIVEGDQITHMRGFGQALPGGETPAPQTSFLIGSTTKSFTALAVIQLVESGKVELDAPIQRYLPWFRVANSQDSAQITVRHLLHQTSGLPLGPAWQLLADFDDSPDAIEKQARSLSTVELSQPVGSAFEYSNLNYNLLGLIIEAASGEPYADYVQSHIFDPLEMRHSYTSKTTAKKEGLAIGHQTWFGMPVAVPDLPMPIGSLPSGQLISSAEDMGHYLIAQLNGGQYSQTQILSPEGIAALHHPAVEAISAGVPMGHYGMGWYINEQDQVRVIHHTGMVPDFYTYMALLPDQKKGVVLLVNANHFTGELSLTEVGNGLTALLTGKQPPQINFGLIPWMMRCLLLIPILQIVGVVATFGLLQRWEKDPLSRPSMKRKWGLYILPSLILNLLVTLMLIPILGPMRGFWRLFMPDFSLIAMISGSFAAIWIFLRTGLILKRLP